MAHPQIGIWWDDGQNLVSRRQPVISGQPQDGVVESCFHAQQVWREAAKQFGVAEDAPDLSISKGRVMFDLQKWEGMILCSPGTPEHRVAEIAQAFSLRRWRREPD